MGTLSAAAPNIPAQVFGSGLIGLREGLEAGIVVMVLIAFLVKAGRRDALKWVWAGVAAAVAMTVGVFLAIQYGAYTIKDLAAEAIAGVASLVAVAIVTSMVLWMRSAAAACPANCAPGCRGHWRPAPWRYSCSPSSPSAGRAWRPRCSWSATPRPRPPGRCWGC